MYALLNVHASVAAAAATTTAAAADPAATPVIATTSVTAAGTAAAAPPAAPHGHPAAPLAAQPPRAEHKWLPTLHRRAEAETIQQGHNVIFPSKSNDKTTLK